MKWCDNPTPYPVNGLGPCDPENEETRHDWDECPKHGLCHVCGGRSH